MAVDVAQAIQDLIQRILNDRETAVQYSEDPEGTLAAQGITEGDASDLDLYQTVRDTCGSTVPGLRDYGPTSGPAGGTSSGPTPPPASSSGSSLDQVVQHLNYVTYETYPNDETIIQNIDNSTNIEDNSTNIDQSQNVNVDAEGSTGNVNVDVDSHDTNVNATGDGSAASGAGPATVGDGNIVAGGDQTGQFNTGDQAAQAFQVGLGREGGGGGIVQNTGDDGVAVGDLDVSGGALSFGEGDAFNAQGNTVEEGAALAQGGDATGVKTDNDELNLELTDVDAENSVVQTEQGEGNANQQDLVDVDAGFTPPVREIQTLEKSGGGEETEEVLEG